MALRRTVELAVDRSVQLDLIIGAAPTREAAMALVSKYQDHRMADRVFEVAATHSRAVLGQLGASEAEAQLTAAGVGRDLPGGRLPCPPSILRRNRKGQPGLWGYAISGDLPIVLLRVSDAENLQPGARPAQGACLLANEGPAHRPGDLERGRLRLPA